MKGCRTCKAWQPGAAVLDRIDPATSGQKVQLGLCRRYAPRPVVIVDDAKTTTAEAQWPCVPSDAWCSEWEPNFS